ncbi:MAG: hypothetical protein L6V93_17005 [Clostridiales bacterium]|nr:MAG: hypothetical protein L6V93_17005 [Clostridiales bacterium]
MKNYKKFLCAFLAVLLLSLTFCPFCLADGEYETEVELQPFMPPIGEIIVDDTLEGTSSYPMSCGAHIVKLCERGQRKHGAYDQQLELGSACFKKIIL